MESPNRTAAPTDVRRCARCGHATLVCEREWHHRVAGIDTPSRTLDLQCQTCGEKVTLHPHTQIAAERLFAFLMLPAIFPSLYFFASARRKTRAWTDNPVVAGRHHEPGRPPDRWCVCGRPAPCVRLIQRRANGIRVGIRYEHRCDVCARTFVVPDAASLVFSFIAASLVSAAGALIIVYPPGSAVGAEESNRWFGVALAAFGLIGWVMFALGLRARMIHPECTGG